MSDNHETNDLLKLIRQHAYHNPLQPRVCQICAVEQCRQQNTPTVRWSKSLQQVLRPPLPVAIMMLVIIIQLVALALTINT